MPRQGAGVAPQDPSFRPNIGVYSGTENKHPIGQFKFNVSTFRDPAGQVQFKQKDSNEAGLNGTVPEVRDWVAKDRRVPIIVKECRLLAEDLIAPQADGKAVSAWLSFSFVDYHGRWIAPAIAELVANHLSEAGFNVLVHHAGLKE